MSSLIPILSSQPSLPTTLCSITKRDIDGDELAQLLHASRAPFMDEGGADSPRHHHYSYWTATPGSTHGQKLDTAVTHSIAVVAAFVTAAQDDESQTDGTAGDWLLAASQESRPSGSGGMFGDGNEAWRWGSQNTDDKRPRKKRRLIGFARAIGDVALVATIYDLAVHPDLQGFGIGHRLVRSLVQQLYSKGIYDIGLVSSLGNASFFQGCSFEDDRQQSVCMTFTGLLPAQGWKDGVRYVMEGEEQQQQTVDTSTHLGMYSREDPGNGGSGGSRDSGSGSIMEGVSSCSESDAEGVSRVDAFSGLEGKLTAGNIQALEKILHVHVHKPPVSDPPKNSTVSNFWNYEM
ncbi:MAG: hypothetical protein WDW38_009415 [Sanguina aurantia]